MEVDYLVKKLESQAEIIRHMIADVGDEQARWKPDAESWSILEVINHLYDEEREDFRRQLEIILHHPGQPLAEIDPRGWVTQRQYNRRELAESLENFLEERCASITWLESLPALDWTAGTDTPFGRISAGDMAASWAAHDLLHIRQLVELRWAYSCELVKPYKVDYAGSW